MAGFLDKLLGKNEKKQEIVSDGGSWTDHEVSVDVSTVDESDTKESAIAEISDATPKSEPVTVQALKPTPTPAPAPAPMPESVAVDTVVLDKFSPQAPETVDSFATTAVLAKDTVDIASIDTQDLKIATNQSDTPHDPLEEISNQIQKEIAAEKSLKEKKEQLEKLIEVTNQLKRPDWSDDEDFNV